MNNVLNEVLNATGNFVTNTVTDATVVASAYDTSGNGGRKLVRLSNGWLVAGTMNGIIRIDFFISKDNGLTWELFGYLYNNGVSFNAFSIISVNTKIYIIVGGNSGNNIYFCTVETTTFTLGSNIFAIAQVLIDTNQSAISSCSLAINETETELHACWSSKNPTYPYSFNIRYCKGTINEDGSVIWGSVEQITHVNTSGADCLYATIILDGLDKPHIYMSWTGSSDKCIIELTTAYITQEWTTIASGWGNKYIGTYSTYDQSSPCAIFVPQSINGLTNGRIWVTWHGTGSSHTSVNYTFLSYSDDGGDTWSDVITIEDMASGNPTITYDKTGLVYVVYQGFGSYGFIRYKTVNNTGIVSGYTLIKDPGTYPSTLIGYTDFTIPLVIYMTSGLINFTGTWTVGEGYTLTMQNPMTLTDGDKVPIVDFEVQQDNQVLELDDIDTEKFVFKGSNLNTDNASIKVLGKDNKLNAIAYAVA